eukprot:361625-Chlamydomonas_euryale.AAC.6
MLREVLCRGNNGQAAANASGGPTTSLMPAPFACSAMQQEGHRDLPHPTKPKPNFPHPTCHFEPLRAQPLAVGAPQTSQVDRRNARMLTKSRCRLWQRHKHRPPCMLTGGRCRCVSLALLHDQARPSCCRVILQVSTKRYIGDSPVLSPSPH